MRWKLEADHAMHDQVLGAGTIIGDDTPYPVRNAKGEIIIQPSASMVALDAEAEAAYEEYITRRQNFGRPADTTVALEDGRLVYPSAQNPVHATPQRALAQPIIPAPIEHIMRPTDMRPDEQPSTMGEIIAKAVQSQLDDARAEHRRIQDEANANALEIKRAMDNAAANAAEQEAAKKKAEAQAEANKTVAPAGATTPPKFAAKPNEELAPKSENTLSLKKDGETAKKG